VLAWAWSSWFIEYAESSSSLRCYKERDVASWALEISSKAFFMCSKSLDFAANSCPIDSLSLFKDISKWRMSSSLWATRLCSSARSFLRAELMVDSELRSFWLTSARCLSLSSCSFVVCSKFSWFWRIYYVCLSFSYWVELSILRSSNRWLRSDLAASISEIM